jgi:hypothetical protein
MPCSANCTACTSATNCTVCDAGLKLLNGACGAPLTGDPLTCRPAGARALHALDRVLVAVPSLRRSWRTRARIMRACSCAAANARRAASQAPRSVHLRTPPPPTLNCRHGMPPRDVHQSQCLRSLPRGLQRLHWAGGMLRVLGRLRFDQLDLQCARTAAASRPPRWEPGGRFCVHLLCLSLPAVPTLPGARAHARPAARVRQGTAPLPAPHKHKPTLDGSRTHPAASNCPDGFYTNGTDCEACSDECATCSSEFACTSCAAPAVLSGDTCACGSARERRAPFVLAPRAVHAQRSAERLLIRRGAPAWAQASSALTLPNRPLSPYPPATCPIGLYANASNVCSPCPLNCTACTSATACTSCDVGAKLVNGACQGALSGRAGAALRDARGDTSLGPAGASNPRSRPRAGPPPPPPHPSSLGAPSNPGPSRRLPRGHL